MVVGTTTTAKICPHLYIAVPIIVNTCDLYHRYQAKVQEYNSCLHRYYIYIYIYNIWKDRAARRYTKGIFIINWFVYSIFIQTIPIIDISNLCLYFFVVNTTKNGSWINRVLPMFKYLYNSIEWICHLWRRCNEYHALYKSIQNLDYIKKKRAHLTKTKQRARDLQLTIYTQLKQVYKHI